MKQQKFSPVVFILTLYPRRLRALKQQPSKQKQAKILEQAANLKPEEVFEKAFNNLLMKRGKGRSSAKAPQGRVDYAKMLDLTVTAPTIAALALPKNGSSPPSGRGNTRPNRQAGRGSSSGGGKGIAGKTVKA